MKLLINKFEKKVAKMENIVRQKVGNDTMDESSLFADSFDLNFGTNSGGGGTSPSPETSDLERLSDELDSDFSIEFYGTLRNKVIETI